MGKSFGLTCAAMLLLSGCVSAPPTTPQVAQTTDSSLGLGPAPAPRFDQAWWKAFNDPQADRLVAQALDKNPSLQSALARIRAAQAELSTARALDYPQVSLDAQEQRELLSNRYGLLPPLGGSWQWVGDAQAHLNWSLDFWGKQAALIDKARSTAEAASLDAAAARLALAGMFAQTYIALSLAYQNLDIAKLTVTERQTILDLTQSRVTSGLENEASLEQARALLALAKIEVRRAETARDLAVHAIAALVGEGAAAYPAITRPAATLETALPLPDALPADLLSRRPDVLAARARISAAMRGRDAAHADFYPNINLVAAIGFQAIGLSSLLSADALTMGVGPALHLPIFDAGRLRAQYARATADLDSAVADYNGAVVTAVRQTADALTQVASLSDQRLEQQKALDSASRALKLAEERYRLGLSGQIPMLTAESTLLTARQQMAALMAEAMAQRVTLLLSLGGGFDPEKAS
ncbi:MAG: transporter [Alphaproteobacteria bacterium]|nr:transporter [Alphaproteobacteria bacterium]MDB5738992.1 transporter [Alphaproteobacteria bacterium]